MTGTRPTPDPSPTSTARVLIPEVPSQHGELAAFQHWLHRRRGLDLPDYQGLWHWSVTDLPGFWGAFAEFAGVRFHTPADLVLADSGRVDGARWFRGATLNYAEHALTARRHQQDTGPALIGVREDGFREECSWPELRDRVASLRAGLRELGVGRGDRVVALAPNTVDTVAVFLAAASLGAVWSACAPDFAAPAAAARLAPLRPKVLVTAHSFLAAGSRSPLAASVAELRERLPELRAVLTVGPDEAYGPAIGAAGAAGAAAAAGPVAGARSVRDLAAAHPGAELAFEPVPFDHPLWVLHSSGTTGPPKGIVQGHGGIVLEHLKTLSLHADLGPGDRFCWHTGTGWMMWNLLVSGLLVDATAVLYDGAPGWPDLDAPWALAARERLTYLGTSAPLLHLSAASGLRPGAAHDLGALRTVGSTGSPLSAAGAEWIHREVGAGVVPASISGGTDVCTAFLQPVPGRPVRAGELGARALGAAAAAFDERGRELTGEVGELVLTRPMPSMPLRFWEDPDGTRMHDSYFARFPGVWRHGDWVRFTDDGAAVVYGRSDATLNRSGVRIGTSELYSVLELVPGVRDCLVVDPRPRPAPGDPDESAGTDGELLCFVELDPEVPLRDARRAIRRALREQLSAQHVPDRIVRVPGVPRTHNGKRCEVPVKRILSGEPAHTVLDPDALTNPWTLAHFEDYAAQRGAARTTADSADTAGTAQTPETDRRRPGT